MIKQEEIVKLLDEFNEHKTKKYDDDKIFKDLLNDIQKIENLS